MGRPFGISSIYQTYVWEGMKVPPVLLETTGDRALAQTEQLIRTQRKRPDMLERKVLSDEDVLLLKNEELENDEKTDFRPASAEDLPYIENLCLDTAEAIGERWTMSLSKVWKTSLRPAEAGYIKQSS